MNRRNWLISIAGAVTGVISGGSFKPKKLTEGRFLLQRGECVLSRRQYDAIRESLSRMSREGTLRINPKAIV